MLGYIQYIVKRFATEVIWVSLGQALALLGTLFLLRELTITLTPIEYGKLALSLTALGIISHVAINSVGASVGRFLPIAIAKERLISFTTASKKILLMSALIALTIGIFIATLLWLNRKNDWAILCLLSFGYATLYFYNYTANIIQNAARRRKTVAIHTSVESWLKILICILVTGAMGATAASVLIGYIITIGLTLISQWHFYNRLISQKINKYKITRKTKINSKKYISKNYRQKATFKPENNKSELYWKFKIWQFGWPFATWGVFTWIQQISDIWLLKIFYSNYEVGLYSVALQLGYTPIILINTFVLVMLGPILNQYINNKKINISKIVWTATILSLMASIFIFILTFKTHELIFGILVGENFNEASIYLPYMVLAGGFFSAGQILSLKLISELNSKRMLGVKVGTSIFGIVLNFVGAYAYGVSGIIGSLIIFSLSYFLSMCWITGKK
jgi:O-antigen/teichoic acid export membrane protein